MVVSSKAKSAACISVPAQTCLEHARTFAQPWRPVTASSPASNPTSPLSRRIKSSVDLFHSLRSDAGYTRASGVMDPTCGLSILELVLGSCGSIQRVSDATSTALLRRYTIRYLGTSQHLKARARGDIVISGCGRLESMYG